MRTFLALLVLIMFFIIFSPIMLILLILRKNHMKLSMNISRHFARGVIKLLLFTSGITVIKEGTENIPCEAALFVADHRSFYDTLICYDCMNRPTGYVAKKELLNIPFLSQWMKLIGCVFLDRHNLKEGLKTILKAIETVRQGYSMVIFPEGTRNKSENKDIPGEFKEGSLKIASKSHCLVVPVAIKNTENCLETHFPWVRKNTARISFLKPFHMENVPEEFKKFPAHYVRKLIEEDLKRPI